MEKEYEMSSYRFSKALAIVVFILAVIIAFHLGHTTPHWSGNMMKKISQHGDRHSYGVLLGLFIISIAYTVIRQFETRVFNTQTINSQTVYNAL
jgi:hypothetical protein